MKIGALVLAGLLRGTAMLSAAASHAAVDDEQLVRALDNEERIAALERDVPALERLWSDDFTVNAPNNRVVVGKQAVLDVFVHAGVIDFATFDRDIEFMRVDGDFAAIMGQETVVPVSDAPAAGLRAGQKITRRFTNIWRREGDTWRLYWRHANVIPPGRTQ